MGLRNWIFDIPWFFIKSRSLLQQGFRTEKKIIGEHISPNLKILDLGCGTGQYSVLFEKDNYVGVDIDGPHLQYAQKQFQDKKFLAFDKNFRIPCKSDFFDLVLCFAVVHHVPPEGTAQFRDEIVRVLKRGGRVLIVDHVPMSYQKSALSKFLVSIDRGKFPRLPERTIELFGNTVRVKERIFVKAGRYTMYVLVLQTR